jgi:hypothetical protein
MHHIHHWKNRRYHTMPKERLHLLLADQSLQILTSSLRSWPLREGQKFAYLLGAVSPDALFYDLPSCRLSSLGTAFHRLQGQACLTFLASVLSERDNNLTPETTAWVLGVASHFIADGLWHPLIEKTCNPETLFHKEFKFATGQCHHWLESELEGYWLPRIGPADGYLPLLKQLAGKNKTREDCIRCFRMVLMHLGLNGIPDEKKLGRCLFWQALLLCQFSLASWAKCKQMFLEFGPTRYLGTLIVPQRSNLSPLEKSSGNGTKSFEDLCRHEFMARSVITIAQHQHALLANRHANRG